MTDLKTELISFEKKKKNTNKQDSKYVYVLTQVEVDLLNSL